MEKLAEPGRREVIEAVVASTVGTTIEWYDFFLYGTAAALVFPRLFFPTMDANAAQLASFSTFTVGFIARPLGGVFFGWMGDHIGRKSTLIATLLLMGISTVLVGVVPTYEQIGIAAPLALVLLRFIQGIGVGGEWGGAVLLALEFGHRGKRGFYASWPQAGVPLGLLASTGVVALFKGTLSEEAFDQWGWRIPFFLSGILIGVGMLIRVRIMETPLFAELQRSKQVAKTPVREVLRKHWWEIILAAGCRIAEQSCFYLFTAYVIAHVPRNRSEAVLLGINLAAAIEFFTIPLFGIISDHWSRKGMYVLGCLVLAGFAMPYFALLATDSPAMIVLAIILSLTVGHAMLYSVQASLIPELFGTRLRYSGASIGYQLASPLAGGLAPLVATELARLYPGEYWPLATYIIAISFLSMVCVLLLAETSRKDISVD